MLRLGIDIGGTFTDLTGIDEETGEVFHLKTPTTPEQPARGVLEALDRDGLPLERVSFLCHGTTNAYGHAHSISQRLLPDLPRCARSY